MRHDFSHINKRKCIIVVCICIFLMGLIFMSQQSGGDEPRRAAIKPEVQVQTVSRQALYRRIVLSGQTVAKARVDIAPIYTGRIAEVRVDLGDSVRQGDVLLIQDTGDVDIAIRQNSAAARVSSAESVEAAASYESNLADKQSQYEHDLRNYQRYESLFEQGAVSREALDDAKQQLTTSRTALDALRNQQINGGAAAVEGKRAAAEKSEHEISALVKKRDDLILRAPRDGVIGYRAAEVGAIATAGQRVLSVVDNSSMYVDCEVSEQDVAVMQTGQTTEVNIESLGQSFAGRIIFISPAISDTQKAYVVRLELANINGRLRDGMFARSEINVLQREQALSVPKDAVVEKNGRVYVYLLRDDDTVAVRDVVCGLRSDTEIEILEGLSAGERIILNNFARLRDGAAVTVEGAGGA